MWGMRYHRTVSRTDFFLRSADELMAHGGDYAAAAADSAAGKAPYKESVVELLERVRKTSAVLMATETKVDESLMPKFKTGSARRALRFR